MSSGHLRWFGTLWQPFRIEIPSSATQLAVDVVEAAVDFVIAHEAAHVIIAHEDEDVRSLRFAGAEITALASGVEREREADAFAARALLNPSGSGAVEMDDEYLVRMFGIYAALEALHQFDGAFFVARPATHPPAFERFMRINGVGRTRFEQGRP